MNGKGHSRSWNGSVARAAHRISALKLPGIAIYKESRRYYPKKALGAHRSATSGLDNVGLAGVESAYNSRVRGQDGTDDPADRFEAGGARGARGASGNGG